MRRESHTRHAAGGDISPAATPVWDPVHVMTVTDWFAERSARGMLTRAVGAWLLVGLPVIAARIWWSVPAAIALFLIAVTTYVAGAVHYMRRDRRQP
jgi:hypothetical protein